MHCLSAQGTGIGVIGPVVPPLLQCNLTLHPVLTSHLSNQTSTTTATTTPVTATTATTALTKTTTEAPSEDVVVRGTGLLRMYLLYLHCLAVAGQAASAGPVLMAGAAAGAAGVALLGVVLGRTIAIMAI